MVRTPGPKRTNKVTATQRLSWNEFKNSQDRTTQTVQVLKFLNGNEANSRQIAATLKIERTAVIRVLNDLWRRGRISISREANCPTTGRKTQFYTIATLADPHNAHVKPGAVKGIQGDIFTDPKNAA